MTLIVADQPDVQAAPGPNIVLILVDDLGYGDLHGLTAQSKIPTPHTDRLVDEGMVFADTRAGAAVCPPTRYGRLTGRYAWRARLTSGVLNGYSQQRIDPGRLTVAALFEQAGYHTAWIGKGWHFPPANSRPRWIGLSPNV